ncbi:hypothetical protein L1887_16272 [Cichorium endivia]|nr:hypothetical protein L1887_16272 [Cichorium endivia]
MSDFRIGFTYPGQISVSKVQSLASGIPLGTYHFKIITQIEFELSKLQFHPSNPTFRNNHLFPLGQYRIVFSLNLCNSDIRFRRF